MLILLSKNHLKLSKNLFQNYLRIKNADKLNFEKTIFESTSTAGCKTRIFRGMDSPLGSESRSSWATFIIDIWYFEEKNSKSARATPQNLRAVKSTKLLVYLTRSAVGVPSLQKKIFFKPGSFRVPNFPHEMAWRSHLINYITKKPERNRNFSFPFFPLFFTSILTTSSWIALGPLCID